MGGGERVAVTHRRVVNKIMVVFTRFYLLSFYFISGKLMLLDRLLLRLRRNNSRFLIFSQFTETLDILEEYVTYRFGPVNQAYFRLDGQTNRIVRELNVQSFNDPESKSFIFLISTSAGGVGINLATADTVILYDSCWNPQVDLQVSLSIRNNYQ